jgi:hypothetical protein
LNRRLYQFRLIWVHHKCSGLEFLEAVNTRISSPNRTRRSREIPNRPTGSFPGTLPRSPFSFRRLRLRPGLVQTRTHPASSEVSRSGGPCPRGGEGLPGLPGGRCSQAEQVTGSSGGGEWGDFPFGAGSRVLSRVASLSYEIAFAASASGRRQSTPDQRASA